MKRIFPEVFRHHEYFAVDDYPTQLYQTLASYKSPRSCSNTAIRMLGQCSIEANAVVSRVVVHGQNIRGAKYFWKKSAS